jgi:carbamoyl-phosphate synthase large subunit
VLFDLNDECKGVIVMRRILRDGDTYKCFTDFNPVIESEVRKIVEHIKPFGTCNVQLRLKDRIPYVIEINARCSGTTAARTLCGFNEPKLIADYLLKNIEPKFQIKIQSILRYWKEIIVENDTITELKSTGVIATEKHAIL